MAGIHDKFKRDKHRKPIYAYKSKFCKYHRKICSKCKIRRKSKYHHYLCDICWEEKRLKRENE